MIDQQDHDDQPAHDADPRQPDDQAAPAHGRQPPGETHAVVGHGDDGHGSAAFPPFDSSTFPSQLLWLTIIFVGLYAFLSRVALPRVATVIEERQDKIVNDLDQASELKSQAEDALKAYEKSLADARAKAGAIAAATHEKLDKEIKALQAEADAEAEANMARAEARIAKAKAEAMESVRLVAQQAAGQIVSHLLGAPVGEDAVGEAVARNMERRG